MSKVKSEGRVRTTDAQIDAAIRRVNSNKKTPTRILEAHFERASDAVVVKLSTEATVIIPRKAIPGFASIDPKQLADLAGQSSGYSVWSHTADAGVRIERLLQIAAGPALTAAGSILGQASTLAKAAAARKNRRKGGRPRKAAKA